MPAKLDRCVEDVKKDPNVDNPYAVCNSVIKGKMALLGARLKLINLKAKEPGIFDKDYQTGQQHPEDFGREIRPSTIEPNVSIVDKKKNKKTDIHLLLNTPLTASIMNLKMKMRSLKTAAENLDESKYPNNKSNKLTAKLKRILRKAKLLSAFTETEHPRDKGGEFTTKGGEGGGKEKPDKNRVFTENLEKAGLRITSDDDEIPGFFNIEEIDPQSNNEYFVDSNLPIPEIKTMIGWAERNTPLDFKVNFVFHGKGGGASGEVGGQSFDAAGETVLDTISIFPAGQQEETVAHEIAHKVFDDLNDQSKDNENLRNAFNDFKEDVDRMKTPSGFTSYMDEYLNSGDKRKYTEVFAAIAQKDSVTKKWRNNIQKQRVLRTYDLLRTVGKMELKEEF